MTVRNLSSSCPVPDKLLIKSIKSNLSSVTASNGSTSNYIRYNEPGGGRTIVMWEGAVPISEGRSPRVKSYPHIPPTLLLRDFNVLSLSSHDTTTLVISRVVVKCDV